MFCKYCGKELREGAAFCSSCGKPVAEKSASPSGIAKKHVILIVTAAAALLLCLFLFLMLRRGSKAASAPELSGEYAAGTETATAERETAEEAAAGQTKPEEGAAGAETRPVEETAEQETQAAAEKPEEPESEEQEKAEPEPDVVVEESPKAESVPAMTADEVEQERNRIKDVIAAGKTDLIKVKAGTDGNPWERNYYYENGNLIFVFFTNATNGDSEQRFYFKDGRMIRWIVGTSPNQTYYNISDGILPAEWSAHETECLAFLGAGEKTTVQAAVSEDWKAAYRTIVEKDSSKQYALIFVNGDDVPELVCYDTATYGAWMYTFYGGKAVTLMEDKPIWAHNQMDYVPAGNVVYFYGGEGGDSVLEIYSIGVSGGLNLDSSLTSMEVDVEHVNCYRNGTEISEEEFDVLVDEYLGRVNSAGAKSVIAEVVSQSEMLGKLSD